VSGNIRVSSRDVMPKAPRTLDSRLSSCHSSNAKRVFRVCKTCADTLADRGNAVGIVEVPVVALLTWMRTRTVLGLAVVGVVLSLTDPFSPRVKVARPWDLRTEDAICTVNQWSELSHYLNKHTFRRP